MQLQSSPPWLWPLPLQYVLDVRRAARGCGCNLNDAGGLAGPRAERAALPVVQPCSSTQAPAVPAPRFRQTRAAAPAVQHSSGLVLLPIPGMPAVLTLFPELHDRITEADVATAAADAAPHEGAAGGTSGTGGSAAAALAGSGGSAGGPGSLAGLAAGGALAAGARRQAAAAAGDGAEADRRSEPVQPLNTG